MLKRFCCVGAAALILAVGLAVSTTGVWARQGAGGQAPGQMVVGADNIGGVVTSANGREAGVWVIAGTRDLATRFIKIVVTDDQGRYMLPELPKATYDVFTRGYGLVESPKVKATPGQSLELHAVVAPTPKAAAQYYPPDYWWALLEVPPKSAFPGTGPDGNGISPNIKTQAEFIGRLKTGCANCHQMGDKATREIQENLGKFESSEAAWDRRLNSGQGGPGMNNVVARFGRKALLRVLADWTDRIAAGEYPTVPPPRPEGVERNVVVTEYDWSDQYSFNHDTISTDKRNPTLHANGPVYMVSRFREPAISVLDPVAIESWSINGQVRDADTPFTNPQVMPFPSPYWGDALIWDGKASLHNPMLDAAGRLWLSNQIRKPENPAFCREGSDLPSAKLFPVNINSQSREMSVYDPKTKKFTFVDTCFGAHHIQFDAKDNLWASGGGEVVGWVDTKKFLATGDEQRSQMWTPFILDTNGNGKRDEGYTEPDQPIDPTKDHRIRGGSYGIIPNPLDGTAWVAAPGYPGQILRIDPGSNPPYTALTEVYEPPFHNPKAPQVIAFTPHGIDIDRNGLIWTFLRGSADIASFDRRKCKVLNGPTATGQHCFEGWTLYPTPGPKFKGMTDADGALVVDSLYYGWVDQFNALGLGENIPIATGTTNESLMALIPSTGKIIRLHVPYPMGFYHRGVDGRIDNPNTGWKGRGLWANFGSYTPWHYEEGKGATSKAVHFQLRPDPLAK